MHNRQRHLRPRDLVVTHTARVVRQAAARWLFYALTLAQAPTAGAQVIGDVVCRTPVAGMPNQFLFTFGYESFEASPILVLPGPQNFFTPGPGNRGQLSTFYPGLHAQAFRIAFDFSGQDSLSWALRNQQYLISKRSRRCAPEAAAPVDLAGSAQGAPINTSLTCIELIPNGYRAVFGYESLERSPVLIASGASNNITPGTTVQRQLRTFYPGYFPRAFRVEVTAVAPALAGDITWNFLGQARLAGLNSPICLSQTRAPIAGTLSVESGGNQSAPINTLFPQPIRVKVLLRGLAVEGVVVRASAPTSGASANFALPTATTDVNGIASFSASANPTAGAYSISFTRTTEAPGPSLSLGLVNQ